MYQGGAPFDISQQAQQMNWQPQPAMQSMQPIQSMDDQEEGDTSRRPPNAFILYSQAMRSQVRQENPQMSNTEVSRLLGKMWKEVPSETKLHYKTEAARMQEEFKRAHPDYTYRKARRKRALTELLTKSQTSMMPGLMPGFSPLAGLGDPQAMQMQMYGMSNQFSPMQQISQLQQIPQMQQMQQMQQLMQIPDQNGQQQPQQANQFMIPGQFQYGMQTDPNSLNQQYTQMHQ